MTQSEAETIIIYVDADACPVKPEIYKVAARCGVPVCVVANTAMSVPDKPGITFVQTDDSFDAADNWIAEHAHPLAIVVTADIPLAGRCIAAGARVLDSRGRIFSEETIGDALASRELQSQLREAGIETSRPRPFGKRDRSEFLQSLDRVIRAAQREMENLK